MQLEKKDADLFYKLYKPLLVYANKKGKISKDINKTEDIDMRKVEGKYLVEIRDYICDHPEIIDSYVEENQEKFSDEELTIIKIWEDFVRKEFYIIEHMKEHTAFFDGSKDGKIYGVLGLYSPLENIVEYIPCIVKAVLLPFKEQIIYDGLIAPYSVRFGPTMRKDLMMDYNEIKAKFGIITSLPFSPKERKESDENLLKFYLKTQKNRELYYKEIQDLKSKNKGLLTIYYQETGKHNATEYSKKLREFIAGNTTVWFALIDDVVVASGKTQQDVEKNLDNTISGEKRNFAHIFKITGKK
ncbi:conserved hypothetical protein [groundwater metagenome]|uniref:Uncharacterized protein n=1 Tax=groundwater metagenome TaxID=717931 RepID=A0A098EBD3_9ZZZZ